MVHLLSYAHMAIGVSKNMQVYSRVESSVRKLCTELAKSKGSTMKSVATVQKQLPKSYAQAPASVGINFEMKKGDWMCVRCSFMNFAKNSQCPQCDEHRPNKYLTGGEWECPQCNFCNFGRNVVCLRCDCKKPGDDRFLGPTLDLRADTSSVEGNTNKIKAGIEEQQWFTKITELEKSSDLSDAPTYGDLPETMKVGDKKFDVSTRNLGVNSDQIDRVTNGDENSINVNITQCLDELVGQKTYSYDCNNGDVGKKSRASRFPGVLSSTSQLEQHNELNTGVDTDTPAQQQMRCEKSSSQLGDNDYVRQQAKNSERWFNKVAEMLEVKDLPDAISDDNFPETMPMRKGENQFVVSKKKDRSLTSPIYKRRVALEQTGKNNYVPFVPFPPGYFAKDKQQKGSESTPSKEENKVNQNPKGFDSQYNSADNYSKSQVKSENASVKASGGGRSLEGSAVKEPDPLDMSEEAKAERWFRRVAQIKDISELSQIPDEDFPSIMPMRKGVNRFVVSKRKTPLERRLTSPPYRRNLPAAGSTPIKKEVDSD